MRIEIWADVVCAWAYIGKRRVERALALLAEGAAGEAGDVGGDIAASAEVVWRPYRIDPAAPAPSERLAEALQAPGAEESLRACAPHLTPDENRDRVARIAAAEGLGPRWGAAWRPDTGPAHRLLLLALEHGGWRLQNAVAEQVMHAHFVEAADVGDPEVLAAAADRGGFHGGARRVEEGGGEAAVRELLLRGKARGIRTSPTIVVGGRALAGAQSAEEIAAFLRQGPGEERSLPEEVERYRLADSLLAARDPLGALELLAPVLAAHPDDRGARFLAARAYYASAQLGRAEKELQSMADEDPTDAYVRLMLGRTLQRQGRDTEAEPYMRLAGVMEPEYA
ncbi:DsbA family oxidoreductase [Nocardiopsis chromatogenes]|uniref:DsbA family oxidoreductase n=1 Tax=Nocardiopsis chromatogenes TaxID=280239 RepID=UPI0003487B68|nr:DsbA family protein [Nocardiopsis chromatogenes]